MSGNGLLRFSYTIFTRIVAYSLQSLSDAWYDDVWLLTCDAKITIIYYESKVENL